MTAPTSPTPPTRDADALVARLVAAYPDEADPTSARVVHAPGRVNLIGEHTDYNEGFVLPVAIDLGISLALVPTGDRRVDITLAATGERDGFDLDAIGSKRSSWIDYVAGTAWALLAAGEPVTGFRALLESDLPQASGLSSSAALELASSLALSGGALPAVDRMTVARLAQRAENEYVGVNSGLMDQFASAFGEPGNALLLDCRTLEHRAVPMPLDQAALVVCHSGSPRRLEASAYNERRAQCEAAVAAIAASRRG
jgi:galactokinase